MWGHAAGVPPDAIGSLPQQSAFRETVFSARWKRAISWAGRAMAVALPSAALAYPHHAGFPAGAGLTLLVVVCWWVPLRMAFSTALRALGATAPAAVGTAIGLILVSAFALWVPPLRLGPLTLLNVAASDRTANVGVQIPSFAEGLVNYYQAHLTADTTALTIVSLAVDALATHRLHLRVDVTLVLIVLAD